MPDTIRITKLDFQTIKPYVSVKMLLAMAVILALFIILSFSNGTAPATGLLMSIGSFFIMGVGSFYVSYPFAVGEQSGIDTLYATLPITRTNVVRGRYLFALSTDLLSAAISYGALALIETLRGASYDWVQSAVVLAVSFGVFSLIQAVQLPLYFRYGYARSKLLAYIPTIATPLLIIGGAQLLKNEQIHRAGLRLLGYASGNVGLSITLVAGLWLVLMALSLAISLQVYSKRDF